MTTKLSDLLEKERIARKEGNLEELKALFKEIMDQSSTDQEAVSLIKILSVRRGQKKECIKWIIHQTYTSRIDTPGFIDFCTSLIDEVIEGKMYLEEERVYITDELRKRYEESGDKKRALEVVLRVPIETYTSIQEDLVIKYQLDQLRLCIDEKDWVRADVTIKKIRKRFFTENDAVGLQTSYYKFIIMFYLGQKRFFEAAKVFLELDKVVSSTEDVVLASLFCIMSTLETEKKDILADRRDLLLLLADKENNSESMRNVVNKFLSAMIISKNFTKQVSNCVKQYIDFSEYQDNLIDAINEHNFKVVEKYYYKIKIEAFCSLIDIDEERLIEKLSFFVNNKFSRCKIDQKLGIVLFEEREYTEEVNDLLKKIVKAEHLIHKERLRNGLL